MPKPKLNGKLHTLALQAELSYWCQNAGIILDGRPFSFENHEYLVDIYQDDRAKKVFKKGAQLGFSTYEVLSAIWSCRNLYPTGVLYLLPTKDDVTDFSKSRFGKIIDENPKTIGRWVAGTDSANIKKINNAYLYLRGSRTRTGLKTISVDKDTFDEFDEMKPGSGIVSADRSVKFDPIALARERYSHSEFQHEDVLSTPTLPDYGVESEYAKSDQKHWYIRCGACGHETCLELSFPSCLRSLNGVVKRVCVKCHAEIHPRNGRWVAHFPGREVSGYYISQLNSVFIAPAVIYEQYHRLDDMKPVQRVEFWNSKIGVGYVDTENRLSEQQVFALCDSYPIADPYRGDPGPCVMGVDQDSKNLWVVLGKKMHGRFARIIYLGVHEEWEELDDLMENFNIWRAVVDAIPEKRNARKFALKHAGKVFMNFYSRHRKGATRWDWNQLSVEENRTESLDDSHELVAKGLISIPRRCEEVELFAKHCHNIAKKLEEDEETGVQQYEYVKVGGANDFRHALNYFNLALEHAPVQHEEPQVEGFRSRFPFMKGQEAVHDCDTYE